MIIINRHNVVLPEVCGCKADDTKGICDNQWCIFPTKALTTETFALTATGKFAKWLIEVTFGVMSLYGVVNMYLIYMRITRD